MDAPGLLRAGRRAGLVIGRGVGDEGEHTGLIGVLGRRGRSVGGFERQLEDLRRAEDGTHGVLHRFVDVYI
jgi:hypothetical protein